MKVQVVLWVFSLLFSIKAVFGQRVAINDTGAAPDSSAIMDVSATNRGMLIPRMTSAQRDAIVAPADGLSVFNADQGCLNYYNNGQWFTLCGSVPAVFPSNAVHCGGVPTVISEVLNPATGKTWMDRNLGASQVAQSSTDPNSYGDLYQWGRRADGHQCRNSPTTTALSNTDQPSHGNFIRSSSTPFDWLSPQNGNLWQGVNGVNNPCPSGYRLPTDAELNDERLSWNANNDAGAFASPLKFPMAGYRRNTDGVLINVGGDGNYWSSTVASNYSRGLNFLSGGALVTNLMRGYGMSVRCIKE